MQIAVDACSVLGEAAAELLSCNFMPRSLAANLGQAVLLHGPSQLHADAPLHDTLDMQPFKPVVTLQAEREWYQQEEGGGVDETHDPFLGDSALFEKRAQEMQRKMVRPCSTWLCSLCATTTDARSWAHDRSGMRLSCMLLLPAVLGRFLQHRAEQVVVCRAWLL